MPTPEAMRAARFPWPEGEPMPTLFRAVGCSVCAKTGYKGRMALHEVMAITEDIERLTVERASSAAIEQVARAEGMITLRHDGLAKVAGRSHVDRRDPAGRGLSARLKQGPRRADADTEASPGGAAARTEEVGVESTPYVAAPGTPAAPPPPPGWAAADLVPGQSWTPPPEPVWTQAPPAPVAPVAAAPVYVPPAPAPPFQPAPVPQAPATSRPGCPRRDTSSPLLRPTASRPGCPHPLRRLPSRCSCLCSASSSPSSRLFSGQARPPAGPAVADTEAAENAYARSSTEDQARDNDFSLIAVLNAMLDQGASDLHLTAGARPTIRLNGSLIQMEDYGVLTPPEIQRVMYAAITQVQRERFEETLELDFAYSLPGRGRFRVNMYRQRDAVGAAFRVIPYEIKDLDTLGIPTSVANFANLPRGFVLVTGPTGSGKSTTLASLVDLANRTRHDHIMTVEDPIEFIHRHKSCLVNQREVGEDTHSFQNALKHVLRQDPDIILVGEMRDLETISVALTAAETGHLVFATLHTQDAAQTIDRIIDVFPPHQQQQIRQQLAMALQGVVCQTLCKTADGRGRVVAAEVLVVTPAVRNLIREGKTHQIYSVMQAGAQFGMQTLDQHLAHLLREGKITHEVGLDKAHHIEDFNRLSGRA